MNDAPGPHYADEPLRKYLEDASARRPTPGGGSVSALAGALACAMAEMAAQFTLGNKKFRDVESEVKECLDELQQVQADLLELMQRDTEAYAKLDAAYALPKKSDSQKAARAEAIQAGLVEAMTPPLQIVRACGQAMRAAAQLVEIANPRLISDVAVAAILAEAAARAARINVEVNLAYLKDEDLVNQTREEVRQLVGKTCDLARRTVAKAEEILGLEKSA